LSRLIGSRGGLIEEVIILRGQIKQGGVILLSKEPDQKQGEVGDDEKLNPDGTLNATTLPSPEPDDAEGREPMPTFVDTPDDYLKTAGSFGMRNTRVLNALTPNDDDAADKEES
jgi:hypothetical protein